jgi:PAN domain
MLKAGQVGVRLAVLGIALMVQGCWENDEDQLTLLGNGGCRAADGSHGAFVTVSQESQDACKAQCFTATEPCTAVEFNSTNGHCELHSQPITKFEKVEGVACYVARADG